jgi:hypothetical protein
MDTSLQQARLASITSGNPLTTLAAIAEFDLLGRPYDQVYIAQGVWEKLKDGGRSWPGGDQFAQADWIERYSARLPHSPHKPTARTASSRQMRPAPAGNPLRPTY